MKTKFLYSVKKLISKLRLNNSAFDSIKMIPNAERKMKIFSFLKQDKVIGICISPLLRDNIILQIEFTNTHLSLYEINTNEKLWILNVRYFKDNINDGVLRISEQYQKYLYNNIEFESYLKNFKLFDTNTLNIRNLVTKLNKYFPLRYIKYQSDNDSEIESMFFGSGILTIEVQRSIIKNYAYGKYCKTYSNNFSGYDIVDTNYYIDMLWDLRNVYSLNEKVLDIYDDIQHYLNSKKMLNY